MFNKNEIEELKNVLPGNAVQELKQRTNFARVTIAKFLDGNVVKHTIAIRIWKEAWNLVRETRQTKAALKKQAMEVMSETYD